MAERSVGSPKMAVISQIVGTEAPEAPGAGSARGDTALRVLIGDSDEATLALLRAMLELADCEVFVARSGPEVLAAAINELPHLVILEGLLPEMDGWSVCDVLSHTMEDTPLVFLSTQCQTADFLRAKEHGASCCIRKPFRLADLLKIIDPLKRDLARHVTGRIHLEEDVPI